MDRIIQFSLNNRALMVLLGLVVAVAGYRSYLQLPAC